MPNKFITKRIVKKHVRNYKRVISEESKNKIKNKENMNSRIENVEQILNKNNKNLPKRKVKYEKKEKGLFERTEGSTIVVTEDNKFMLND